MSSITQLPRQIRQPVQSDLIRFSREMDGVDDVTSTEAIHTRVAQIKNRWDASETKRREMMGIKRRAELLSLVAECI